MRGARRRRLRVLVAVFGVGAFIAACRSSSEPGKNVLVKPRAPEPVAFVPLPADGGGVVQAGLDGVWHLRGHTQTIYSVAVSGDGKRAATGSADHTVRLWDLEKHVEQAVIAGGQETITALRFSARGDLLAAGDRAFQVRVIDVATGSVVRVQAHPDAISDVTFSDDGLWLGVSGFGGNAAVYPVAGAGVLKGCELHGRSIDFTNGGKQVVTANETGSLYVYDFPACTIVKQIPTEGQVPFASASAVSALVATHDGRQKKILLWDVAAGKLLRTLEGHSAGVTTAVLTPDGSRLLSASEDGTLRFWDVASGKVTQRVQVGGVPFAAFSADGSLAVVAAGLDAQIVKRAP